MQVRAVNATIASVVIPAATTVQVGRSDTLGIQLAGTLVGTIVIEGSVDGTNYVAIAVQTVAGGATATSITVSGIYLNAFSIAPFLYVRVNATAFTSGSSVVTLGLGRTGS